MHLTTRVEFKEASQESEEFLRWTPQFEGEPQLSEPGPLKIHTIKLQECCLPKQIVQPTTLKSQHKLTTNPAGTVGHIPKVLEIHQNHLPIAYVMLKLTKNECSFFTWMEMIGFDQ